MANANKTENSFIKTTEKFAYNFFSFKMRVRLILFFIILLSFLLAYSGLWWLAFIVGFFGGLLLEKARMGFIIGFLGVLIGWTIHMALIAFFQDLDVLNFLLSIFGLNVGWLVLITLVLGGLLGGFGGLNGTCFRKIVQETRWYKNSSPRNRVPPE